MLRILRHVESTYNRWNDDSRDSPLTDNGKRMASQLTGQYDIVVLSTLKRARHTLDYSQITYGNIMYSDLCREVLSGPQSHLYNGEAQHTESDVDVSTRVKQFGQLLLSLLNKHQKILIISHNEFLFKLCNQRFNVGQSVDFCFDRVKQTFNPVVQAPPTPIVTPMQQPATPVNPVQKFGSATPQFGAIAQPIGAIAQPIGAIAQPIGAIAQPIGAQVQFGALNQSSFGASGQNTFGASGQNTFGASGQNTFGASGQNTFGSFPPIK